MYVYCDSTQEPTHIEIKTKTQSGSDFFFVSQGMVNQSPFNHPNTFPAQILEQIAMMKET